MQDAIEAVDPEASRRVNMLLRSILLWLFASGILAIFVLWVLEARFGLLNDICRVAYPTMIASLAVGSAMLYRWPGSIIVARWIALLATIVPLCIIFVSAIRGSAPLAGDYAFISMLMWLPLGYAIALLMLEPRHARWTACALFALVATGSAWHQINVATISPGDQALLINLVAAHIVLLVCLSGLVKFRQALVTADSNSRHFFRQASTDPLTGLANRRHGLEMLRRAAAHHDAESPSAVILCDIDHFKEINDRHGHDAGDKVVLKIASALQNCTRNVDTVVRWGGDEFLIVVPRIGAAALAELAERLRTRAAEAMQIDKASRITPQLSIGVAAMVVGEKPGSWIKRADEALYRAKAGGRNRCVFAPDGASGALPSLSSVPSESGGRPRLVREAG